MSATTFTVEERQALSDKITDALDEIVPKGVAVVCILAITMAEEGEDDGKDCDHEGEDCGHEEAFTRISNLSGEEANDMLRDYLEGEDEEPSPRPKPS